MLGNKSLWLLAFGLFMNSALVLADEGTLSLLEANQFFPLLPKQSPAIQPKIKVTGQKWFLDNTFASQAQMDLFKLFVANLDISQFDKQARSNEFLLITNKLSDGWGDFAYLQKVAAFLSSDQPHLSMNNISLISPLDKELVSSLMTLPVNHHWLTFEKSGNPVFDITPETQQYLDSDRFRLFLAASPPTSFFQHTNQSANGFYLGEMLHFEPRMLQHKNIKELCNDFSLSLRTYYSDIETYYTDILGQRIKDDDGFTLHHEVKRLTPTLLNENKTRENLKLLYSSLLSYDTLINHQDKYMDQDYDPSDSEEEDMDDSDNEPAKTHESSGSGSCSPGNHFVDCMLSPRFGLGIHDAGLLLDQELLTAYQNYKTGQGANFNQWLDDFLDHHPAFSEALTNETTRTGQQTFFTQRSNYFYGYLKREAGQLGFIHTVCGQTRKVFLSLSCL